MQHPDIAAAKSDASVYQLNPAPRVYGRYAAGRSLAPLVSGYKTETVFVLDIFPTRQFSLSYKNSLPLPSTLTHLSYTQRCRVYGV